VRLEGFGELKKSNDINGIRARDIPACSTTGIEHNFITIKSDIHVMKNLDLGNV
jgi:hypothetical protein